MSNAEAVARQFSDSATPAHTTFGVTAIMPWHILVAMVNTHQIQGIGRTIAKRFNPRQIILFGSYAYGTPTEDSDLDLLVVMDHTEPAARKAAEIRLALPSNIPMDVIVRSPKRVQERLDMEDGFMGDICNRGRSLYEAPNE